MGWTEITPYAFDVYEGWEEVPVSIADPGGTEIDVRFNSDDDGGSRLCSHPCSASGTSRRARTRGSRT